jgi:hypothetical protein
MMKRFYFLPAAALLLAGFAVQSSAQVVCTLSAGAAPMVRTEGYTELLGDLVITCTGGTPTAAGNVVPQMNLELFLNTNITSKVTSDNSTGTYSEALLLVDDPNQVHMAGVTPHPILNCGQNGAADNGLSGPGICSTVSTGDTTQTYDGTACLTATYGCGRPNAFQGRMQTSSTNAMVFFGVPFDPPGNQVHTYRITNLRSNVASLVGAPPPLQVTAMVSFAGPLNILFIPGATTTAEATVAFAQSGLKASVTAPGVITITEGFAGAWKPKNVAFTLANAAYSGGKYVYNMGTSYPAAAAQNVPGILYSDEDGFQWNAANPPPAVNPPVGYGLAMESATDVNFPLNSAGLGFMGTNTGISADGMASAGTRIALTFEAPAEMVTVPDVVYLHPVGSPNAVSGVLKLTATDAAGAGAYNPVTVTTIHNSGTFIYEVLYADPFAIQSATVPVTITGMHIALAYASFAPFYNGTAAGLATPTAAHPTPVAVPRFTLAGIIMLML